MRWMSWLVSQPSRPGTLKRWSSAEEAGPAAQMPTIVSRSQPSATKRLCWRTRRVRRCIMWTVLRREGAQARGVVAARPDVGNTADRMGAVGLAPFQSADFGLAQACAARAWAAAG